MQDFTISGTVTQLPHCDPVMIKTVQGNLGHATAAFTLDVYGHVTNQMQEASAVRMEAYIKGILEL